MSRPKRCRWVFANPSVTVFKPRGIPMSSLQQVVLTLDEIEALILSDLEEQYQAQAADRMKVSRTTFGRILTSAHRKVADALVYGKAMMIEPGRGVQRIEAVECDVCGFAWEIMPGDDLAVCPSCGLSVGPGERGAD